MTPPSDRDYLSLLKGELTEQTRRAHAAVEEAAQTAASAPPAVCIDATRQLQSVLHTLGLERLSLLAHELCIGAQSLGMPARERLDDKVAILRNGLDLLRDGIERRSRGRPEDSWGILSVLNELRATSSRPLASETCLFSPTLEARLAAAEVVVGSGSDGIDELARGERIVLHRGMFLWYSGEEPERGLRKLRRVAQVLRRAAGTERLRYFCFALEAVAVGIAEQPVPAGGAIRRILAEVDRLLRRLAEDGEESVASALPPDLLRNLLFCVATSGSHHHLVKAVRRDSDLRLLFATGPDGLDRASERLLDELVQLRALLEQTEQAADGHLVGRLVSAAQRLSDGLALAELGDQRRQLEAPIEELRRLAGGMRDPAAVYTDFDGVLAAVEQTLRFNASGANRTYSPGRSLPVGDIDEEALVDLGTVETTVTEEDVDFDLSTDAGHGEGESAAALASATIESDLGLVPRDQEIREVFADEALDKVEALRRNYVAWSAQRDSSELLDSTRWILSSLTSAGRLVGADALSEICWVLEAALRQCGEGTLPVGEDVVAVLDEGIETVEALVIAYLQGRPVDQDPRSVEQRIHALLSRDAPGGVAATGSAGGIGEPTLPSLGGGAQPADTPGAATGAEALAGEAGLVKLFVAEAGDLAETLEEGLRGLEREPGRSAWLVDVRRALRALAAAARHAGLESISALGEACDEFLERTAESEQVLGAEVLALTREATEAIGAAVDALRHSRLPHPAAELVERLRAARAALPPSAVPVTKPPSRTPLVGQLFDCAGAAAVHHLQLEEQTAVLREQVGQLEGTVALLRRLPPGEAAQALPPRLVSALEELGGCADRLHEASLTISAQLRGQGHQLTALQHGLVAAFGEGGGSTFSDLLLVTVGDAVYGLPTAAVESVRRVAPELVPSDGEPLELPGRSVAYRHLADLVGRARAADASPGRALAIVLTRVADGVQALGVDRVLGQRTLLVRPVEDRAGEPGWLAARAALGGERQAAVLDPAALALAASA